MSNDFEFKRVHSIDNRKRESMRILKKYPYRVPVIVEKASKSDVPDIDKHKFLVPDDLTVAQFCYVIRKRIKLTPEKALFLFVNNQLPASATLMSQIYKENKDSDNFLYFFYSGETCFGIDLCCF